MFTSDVPDIVTDDPAIAEVAKQYGCDVPFMRPADIADDKAAHLPVLQHAVKALKEKDGYEAVQVACRVKKAKNSNAAEKGHLKAAGFEAGGSFAGFSKTSQ